MLGMGWSRLWLMLGCLLLWGAGSATLPGEWRAASKADGPTSHGIASVHAKVLAIDDVEPDFAACLGERLKVDAHVAPHWQAAVAPARDWRHERAALPPARRASAPPLTGIVELLI